MLFLITAVNLLLLPVIGRKDEAQLLRLLHRLGLVMILAEIWKQWYCLRYVYPDFSLWFFPWQLCSMPMYCSFLIIYVKEKYQKVLLVFLSTFSLFAAVIALLIPSDMLRPQIPLAVHGMVFHGMIILEAMIAIRLLRDRTNIRFAPSAVLYLLMSAVAEVINCIGHYLLPAHQPEPDMFYITPFYPSTQPVCAYVAQKLGVLPEIVIYSAAIIVFSYVCYRGMCYWGRFSMTPS